MTQVNEILQRMESFAGVFIAATNFLQNLDPASIRRFTFKLAFDYLDHDGKMEFFHKMFKTELTPEETLLDGSAVTCRVRVRNTGSRPGREVVQIYVSASDGRIDRPRQELAAFAKTFA